VFRLIAQSSPTGTPMIQEMVIAIRPIWAVIGPRRLITSAIGSPRQNEVPMLPLSTSPIQARYCW
jgi:hypothetical protein